MKEPRKKHHESHENDKYERGQRSKSLSPLVKGCTAPRLRTWSLASRNQIPYHFKWV